MSSDSGHLTTQYNLRWSDDLKSKIAESAKSHNRSMNADIIARLEQSFVYNAALPKILDDQIINTLDSLQNLKSLFGIIKNLQEQVEKQNELLEQFQNKID
ncbi:Arc family DNA-binding protein [Acinetobacter sp. MD2(2019)]|uniref:Arc family DNA-binding protein n=1 Tax=Acinetobacter sp. MD2(2019) TaxID=2605273 RepID=UPI002D1E8921|nr:Arc family DNA-binding protein [Acinetobacter sp. MD2(2019)]MEB3753819.1 Arc family DNA-binding protein [Acinetobacter sp. MD2(2019)]